MTRTRAGASIGVHADKTSPFGPALDPYRIGSYPGQLHVAKLRPVGGAVKRGLDVVLALTALVLVSPTILLIAALRMRVGRGILVGEDYVGFNGRGFTAYTFGTLPDERAGKWVRACLHMLREARLDRLPMLYSILRGDMSFVGPQPLQRSELDRDGRGMQAYLAARPGLINLRRANPSGRRAFARYYAQHWSLWLDLVLLVSAVTAVRETR
jgi:lipopolysaccharide/colanic/teichoic acid biosynthesis glycosyltransferase